MSNDSLANLADKLAAEADTNMEEQDEAVESRPKNSAAEAPADPVNDRNLDLILDIPLKVTVELGRTRMPVSDLLNLGQGSVIELNKLAGEPLEVLVNDKLIAKGEAVVVNEKFGIRLLDIISPKERVEQLK